MAITKKEIESWRLERFKSFIADFPNGRIEPTEEPDFLVHEECRTVGIELTELHRETMPGQVPLQAREAMRNRVVTRAKEIFDSRNHQAVLATFHLNDQVHIAKTEVEQFAINLADLVSANIPRQNSTIKFPSGWGDFRKRPSILYELSVHRLDAVTKTFFNAPSSAWIATINRQDIQRALDSKEPKHATYRIRCDEAWLVINADTERMSTWFEFDPSSLAVPFLTDFSRVFLVLHFEGKVYELNICAIGP